MLDVLVVIWGGTRGCACVVVGTQTALDLGGVDAASHAAAAGQGPQRRETDERTGGVGRTNGEWGEELLGLRVVVVVVAVVKVRVVVVLGTREVVDLTAQRDLVSWRGRVALVIVRILGRGFGWVVGELVPLLLLLVVVIAR